MRFAPGRTVLYRNTHHGRVVNVRPCRVVSDDDRGLLLWLPRGSVMAIEVADDGRGIRQMPFREWAGLGRGGSGRRLVAGAWQGPGILKFLPPDVEHSVWFFFDDEGRFANWYVNLEEHAIRWDDGEVAGVDVIDQDLDVVAYPDHTWAWKDEEEFAERLALPDDYWVPDEAAVWAEGRRVTKLIEAAEFPFDGTWTDFTADPAWPIPRDLPAGWDRPAVRRS
jgi:hypothetical protein